MTSPSVTARTTPSGERLRDGYQSLIAFAADADVSLWEKSVTPPGVDGGEPVDSTTMHNTAVRTKGPRALIDFSECKMTCGYDPQVYGQIIALVNVETSITIHFPDGSTLCFFGYLQKFDPKELKEGTPPEADVVIVATNTDEDGKEATPDYDTSGTGT